LVKLYYLNFQFQIKFEINEQKKRGLNNYNPLLEVLRPSDEVRLHSRMLGSILNPNGKHYQDDLFLRKFIEILNIEFDSKNATLKKEYENIDIYITDGNKHIIIENKIYADDQKCQISRYIKKIKELTEALDKDIFVVYITNQNKNCPDGHLCKEGYIQPTEKCKSEVIDFKVKYKRLSYQNDILNWLKKCQKEIRNITNLNIAFEFYIQVVQKITKKFKGTIMGLNEEIAKKPEYAKLALEINQIKIKIELIKQLFDKIEEKFSFYKYFNGYKITNELNFDECLNDFFDKQRNRAKNFGKIFNLEGEFKLLTMIGKKYFHYGLIKVKDGNIIDLEKLDESKENELKKLGWEYRNFNKKFYSKRINFYDMNKDTIKKLTIDRGNFIQKIKEEVKKVLKILKQSNL
jgi:hypothetical protein